MAQKLAEAGQPPADARWPNQGQARPGLRQHTPGPATASPSSGASHSRSHCFRWPAQKDRRPGVPPSAPPESPCGRALQQTACSRRPQLRRPSATSHVAIERGIATARVRAGAAAAERFKGLARRFAPAGRCARRAASATPEAASAIKTTAKRSPVAVPQHAREVAALPALRARSPQSRAGSNQQARSSPAMAGGASGVCCCGQCRSKLLRTSGKKGVAVFPPRASPR